MHILNNASRCGFIIYLILTVVLTIFALTNWDIADVYLLMALLWGYLAGMQIGYNKITGKMKLF